ncbi:4-alpha-L-fucosyltransferase [Gryganskiella cystojenkinii]|nr:4-alpha-L-fucosyltransferase [Gryganskiella cystojenkinii]
MEAPPMATPEMGSVIFSTAFNATVLTLLDAGIPLNSIVGSVTCIIDEKSGEILIDPTNVELTQAKSTRVFVFDSKDSIGDKMETDDDNTSPILITDSTGLLHYRRPQSFDDFFKSRPSAEDLRLLKEKPAKLETYLAREQLISKLNGDWEVSVQVSNPAWMSSMLVSEKLIHNCPVPCHFSKNKEYGFTEEQAKTKDAIMAVDGPNYPEKKPIAKFQRWVLFGHEAHGDTILNQTWFESLGADIYMNFREDVSQVAVSYIDYPHGITNPNKVFNMTEFVDYNKNRTTERRPIISWFSSHVTPFREKWGLGLLDSIGNDDFAYFTHSQYSDRTQSIVPEPCREMDSYQARTCATAYYPFTLAIENTFEEDYASEKLWSAFESGVVPVIAGAPNVRSFIPVGSAIFIEDFASPEELGKYLLEVSQDVLKYQKYNAWKSLPQEQWPEGFRSKIKYSRANMQCNLCVELARQRYLELLEKAEALS